MTSKLDFDSLRALPSGTSGSDLSGSLQSIPKTSKRNEVRISAGQLGYYWLWCIRTKLHWFWFWILRTRSKPGLVFKTQNLFIIKELDLKVDS
jgi:hypothetical protein